MRHNTIASRQKKLFLLCLAVSLFYIVIASKNTFTIQPLPVSPTNHSRKHVGAAGGRTLVILLDSARYPEVFNPAYMPFTSQTVKRGVWGYSEVVGIPLSIAGDHALFEGKIDSIFSIAEDFTPAPSKEDNLFRRLTARGKKVILIGELIHPAYRNDAEKTSYKPVKHYFSEYRKDAEDTFLQAISILRNKPWDMAVVQFVSIDYLGHLETPKSANNLPLYRKIDRYVKALVALTGEHDKVLITGEHGMDDHGFHIDRSRLVVNSPFILWGPDVQHRKKPLYIDQIDWAPTLSLLNGINPVYPSIAIPAFSFLRLADSEKHALIQRFAEHLGGKTAISTPGALYQLRGARQKQGKSKLFVFLLPCFIVLSLAMLIYIALLPEREDHPLIKTLFYCAYAMLLFFALMQLDVIEILAMAPPFSANYIKGHPAGTLIYFSLFAVIGLATRIFLRFISVNLAVFSMVTAGPLMATLLMSGNPYHLFNWILIGLPLFAWGVSGKWQWLGLFVLFWAGLSIRRISFFIAYGKPFLPPQWFFALPVIFLATGVSWFLRHGKTNANSRHLSGFTGLLVLLPSLLVIMLRPHATLSAALLLLALLPVAFAAHRDHAIRNVLWAAWIALFYAGTSGSVEHLTQIVALPVFLLAWYCMQHTSHRFSGIVMLSVVWMMYLLPGNTFDLRLSEFVDQYIMSTATSENIGATILLVFSRYVIPLTVLMGIAMADMHQEQRNTQIASMLFPLLFASGVLFYFILANNTALYPWQEKIRTVIVLVVLTLVLTSSTMGIVLNRLKLWKTKSP